MFHHQLKFLSKPEVDSILSYCEKKTMLSGTTQSGNIKNERKSQIAWIDYDKDLLWIYEKIENIVTAANKNFWNIDVLGFIGSLQYTEYGVGDKYDWHSDIGVGFSSQRKISVSIVLNDDYEGGEFEFYYYKPENVSTGTIIMFPSYEMHRVSPVTKGVRKSLVAWIDGPPFR